MPAANLSVTLLGKGDSAGVIKSKSYNGDVLDLLGPVQLQQSL